MKKNRILAFALSLTFVTACLASCGKPAATNPNSNSSAVSSASASSGSADTSSEPALGEKPADYPTENITWIVPAAAGAAIDLPTRALIESLDLGANIVVENIAGASQTIGTAEAKNRDADGYTLLTAANGGMLLQPSLVDLTYDTFKDFRHIAMIASPDPMAIAVSADSDISSIEDLLGKLEQGERVTWSFSNSGGVGHLAGLDLMSQKGYSSAEFVPFNGSAEVITALLGNHIDFIILDASVIAQRVSQGQVKALAVLADEELATLPGVPAIADYGVENMGAYVGFKWLAVRADTPDEIVEYLKAQVNEATQTEEFQQYLTDNFFAPLDVYTEEEVTEMITSSFNSCGEMLTQLGLHK